MKPTPTHTNQRQFTMINIGSTLKSLRAEKGYTLRQVAAKAQIPFSHLSNIENGKKIPGIDVIDRICFALEVPIKNVILKAELERELQQGRQVLYRDLQPYFRKIDAVAKQIYGSHSDSGERDDDGGVNREILAPITKGGGGNEVDNE